MIDNLSKTSWLKHTMFWLGYWILQSLLMNHDNNFGFYLAKNLSMVGVQILIVYLNLFVLIPFIYLKGKLVLYFLLGGTIIYLGYTVSFHFIQFVLARANDLFASIYPLRFPNDVLTFQYDFWRIFSGSVPYSLAFVCSTAYYLTKANALKEKEKTWLALEKNKTELKFLKSQISPHFLFNSLNNLHYLIGKDQKLSERYTLQLSEILRYIVYESKEDKVLLKAEIKHIEAYIELLRMSIESPTKITYIKNTPSNELLVSPLILLSIIENGFKHSGIKYNKKSTLDIVLKLIDNQLVLKMRNTIEKKAPSQTDRSTSLRNLRTRLDLLYPNKHEFQFQIENEEAFTSLMIDLK